MRKVAWLGILLLTLPLAAFANDIGLTNVGGAVVGSASGLVLSGSTLTIYGNTVGTNLGSVTFTTGAFTSGDIKTGGTLAAGGSFVVTGNGTNGVPNGVIFNDTFSGPVTWSVIELANGTYNYNLAGALVATNGNGEVGATTLLTFNTGSSPFSGSVDVASEDTSLTITAPEPGTLSLFGTGLLGLAGFIRRKRAASHPQGKLQL